MAFLYTTLSGLARKPVEAIISSDIALGYISLFLGTQILQLYNKKNSVMQIK